MTTTLARPATDHPVLVTLTRVLAALFGVLKLAAATFFLFFSAQFAPQSTGDRLVGAWSIAIGLAYLVIAARLGRDLRVLPMTIGLAVADVAFSGVKFFVYHEPEAIGFTVTTLLLLLLVVAATRTRRPA